MSWRVLGPVLCSLALAACAHGPRSPGGRAPVVVAIVVDQLAGWVGAERFPLLPERGGFARLRREGTWVQSLEYAHAATETAPGHASLHTGLPPRAHGVFANERPIGRNKRVPVLIDESTTLVDARGPRPEVGASAARFEAPTIADRLRAESPGATIVSFSLKDRAAIPGGGRKPDLTLWFDAKLDRFVSSTAFAPSGALPPFVRELADTVAQRVRAQPWTVLDPAWVARAGFPDAQAGEGDFGNFGVTFPHVASTSAKPSMAFRATPAGDEAVLALAEAALRELRRADQPMLLSLSLSSNDYVGHVFGPDSWEAWDTLLRLDAALARLFDTLDDAVGPEGWSAVLAGDHGTHPTPETTGPTRAWCPGPDPWERACTPGTRLVNDPVEDALDRAAIAALGPGEWLLGVADPFVVLSDSARALPADRRDLLLAALTAELMKMPGIQAVRRTDTWPGECPRDGSLDAFVCASVSRPGRPSPGELFVATQPGSFFDSNYVVGFGTSHGTIFRYDRAVPLLVRAPGRVRGGVVESIPRAFSAYAGTLAGLLGLSAEPTADRGLVP